jgi:hypothetical protein
MVAATDLIKYFTATGRDYTAANLQWTHVMKNFETQLKALKAKQKEDPPETPKISKALPVIKWTESFRDFLNRVIGVRTISLCYVIRETVNVPAAAPVGRFGAIIVPLRAGTTAMVILFLLSCQLPYCY